MSAESLIQAARLPINRPQMSAIINGHILPTLPTLMSICEVLDAAPFALYDTRDIDLLRAQAIWDERHGTGQKWQGHPEVRARLKPDVRERLQYVLFHSGRQSFAEWLRGVIEAEYGRLRLADRETHTDG